MLHLMNQPHIALELAKQNWQVQREPADTYVLLQAAIAANDIEMIQKVEHWLSKQGANDVLIQQILATQEGKGYDI